MKSIIPDHLQNYTWRSLQEDDGARIEEMVNAAAKIDRAEAGVSQERVQQIFAMLGKDVATDTLTAVSPQGTIAALALILTPPQEDEHLAMISGIVHPDHRGKGIGNTILNWMEERARQKFNQFNDNKPRLLRTSCQDFMAERIALFKQHQFEAARYSYKMRRDLAQPLPEKPLPQGLQLINWTEEIDSDLMHTFNDAFSEQWVLPQLGR
jgi:mycothiol synthase